MESSRSLELRIPVQNGDVVLRCREDLRSQANGLLDTVRELDTVRAIHAGTRILFGGAPLKIDARDGSLVVLEPEYFGPSPLAAWRDDVSTTLLTLASQVSLVKAIGISGEDCSFVKNVVVDRELSTKRRVYMQRSLPSNDADTGWFASSAEEEDLKRGELPASAYEAIPAFALLQRAPALVQALTLPLGYIADFEGRVLERVLDDKDRVVWRRRVGRG